MRANVLVASLLICLAALDSAGQDQQAKNLTFEEALNLTLTNNHLMKQYADKSRQMEQEVKAAKGLHLPNVNIVASYQLMSDNINLDLTPVRDAFAPLYSALGTYGKFGGVINPQTGTALPDEASTSLIRTKMMEGYQTVMSADWVKTIQEKNFGMVNAGFALPLYTGGKINAANRAAKIKFEESEIEIRQKSFELSTELVERYFGLALATQAVKVRNDVRVGMKRHFDDATKLVEQGMIANVEALNAKVYFSDADREQKKAQRQVEILNQAVLNTVADSSATAIVPVSELFYLETIEPLDYFKKMASQKSPLLQQVNKRKELAHQGVMVEKSAYMPSVAAMGTYDLVNKDLSPYLPSYVVGVGLKWNLFDGMTRERKVKAAQYQEMQASDFYSKAESDISTAVTKAYQELQMYQEQIRELDTAMEFTNEYNRARDKAFTEGMATTTQVSDANLAVAKVKIERLQAIYGWDVALSKLLYYSGLSDQFVSYMAKPEVVRFRY